VNSIAPASGQEFALLPPDNATGNFTKIVQRIPVKITIDPNDPLIGRLRPGMSVEPTIDTRGNGDPSGGVASGGAPSGGSVASSGGIASSGVASSGGVASGGVASISGKPSGNGGASSVGQASGADDTHGKGA